jgi:hypothetical protein
MSPTLYRALVVYFSIIIIVSIIVLIKASTPSTPDNSYRLENKTIEKPQKKSIIISTKNSTYITVHEFNTSNLPNEGKETNDTLTVTRILPNERFQMDNSEVRLVILSILFGVLGSSVHGITSLTRWRSSNKLEGSYVTWYLIRPLIGASLAFIMYVVLRAGLITGGPAVTNEIGVAAISALVGLMNTQVTKKLRDVFDTIFGIEKEDEERGDIPSSGIVVKLNIDNNELHLDDKAEVTVTINESDGTPINNAKVLLEIQDPKIIEADDGVKETNSAGVAIFKITGKGVGETFLNVKVTAKDKQGKTMEANAEDDLLLKVNKSK